MDFPGESLPILAGIITNTGKAMTTTMKYTAITVTVVDGFIKQIFGTTMRAPKCSATYHRLLRMRRQSCTSLGVHLMKQPAVGWTKQSALQLNITRDK